MANRFTIHYECGINIPEVRLTVEGHEPIILVNHQDTEVDLEPGMHRLTAEYVMNAGGNTLDFCKQVDLYVERGCNYDAVVCMILKSFSIKKRYEGMMSCC